MDPTWFNELSNFVEGVECSNQIVRICAILIKKELLETLAGKKLLQI